MKYGIIGLCVLALAGCSSQTTKPTTVVGAKPAPVVKPSNNTPKALWQSRQQTLAKMQRWNLKGRVGLQLNSQSWAFGIQWDQQNNNQFRMNFLNPLTGGLLAALNSSGRQVSLVSSDGKRFSDTSAENLLAKQLGVRLPLTGMRYWARGTVAPGSPVEGFKLDTRGRPTMLQQQGWTITYSSYMDNSHTAMPRRVQLSRTVDRMKVKMVVKNWQVGF